jgi:hypothetical protein
MNNNNRNMIAAVGLLIGALIGVILGFLFEPNPYEPKRHLPDEIELKD